MRKGTNLRKKPMTAIFLILLPIFAIALAMLGKTVYVSWILPHVPGCVIRTLTGLKCPSCGMTHAVLSLFRGDIVGAVRENLMVPVGVLLGILWYIGCWMEFFGSEKKIIPKTSKFWLGVLGIWLLYTVLRNLLGG
ncbi:MAG: DUF2752 domain-containing protein [Oscillospiraceae bacterium]|nr:DUF2752 domain-containing protein [Oscillospiraceae bacterium]